MCTTFEIDRDRSDEGGRSMGLGPARQEERHQQDIRRGIVPPSTPPSASSSSTRSFLFHSASFLSPQPVGGSKNNSNNGNSNDQNNNNNDDENGRFGLFGGLFLMLISSIMYSAMGIFLKFASSAGIPSAELVMIRAIFQGTIVVACMPFFPDTYSPPRTSRSSSATAITYTRIRTTTNNIIPDDGNALDDETSSTINHTTPTRRTNNNVTMTRRTGLAYYQYDSTIRRPFGRKEVRWIVVLRGVVGGIGFCLYFYTLSHLPLGDATALLSLNPIVTLLAAAIFLGETMQCSHIVASLASVIGSVLIAKPNLLCNIASGICVSKDEGIDSQDTSSSSTTTTATGKESDGNSMNWGYLTALLGTCCGAGVYVLIRKAGTCGVHTLQLLFSWVVFGILFSVTVQLVETFGSNHDDDHASVFVMPPSLTVWGYILAMSCLGSIGHFLMNYSGRFVPAGLTSIVRSSSIFFSYIWEVLIFHETISAGTMLGVSFIFVSLVVVALTPQSSSEGAAPKDFKTAQYTKCSQEFTPDDDADDDERTATESFDDECILGIPSATESDEEKA